MKVNGRWVVEVVQEVRVPRASGAARKVDGEGGVKRDETGVM